MIGLGNPGARYDQTRHNVGFALVDALVHEHHLRVQRPFPGRCVYAWFGSVLLVKPLTYMNRSGEILPFLMRRFGVTVESLIVVVDNMDLSPGEIRMKRRGSPASHNGLRSISGELDSDDYSRLYIGVGRPVPEVDIITHVLGRFSEHEQIAVTGAIARAASVLSDAESQTIEQIISSINAQRRPPQAV